MVEGTFKLAKAAAKSGGDKYEGKLDGSDLQIYLPQSVTRVDGKPVAELVLTINVK
jgi:hypothetical protein